MLELPLGELAAAIDGQLSHPADATHRIRGVGIDSRSVTAGQAFFAIAGERMDGHAFAWEAAAAGADLIVVHRALDDPALAHVPVARVADTTCALGQLARYWRQRLDPTVIGITGSLGKTTTKELAQQILRLHGPTQHNRGNLNNHIGVPLTLLDLEPRTRYAVVEMGMNAPGEIAYLSQLAEPDVACITAIAPVHLAQLGSLEAIAAAKAEIVEGLAPDGLLVLPSDAELLASKVQHHPASRRLRFGSTAESDVRLLNVVCRGEDGCEIDLTLRDEPLCVKLPLPGVHNARNAAAAAAIALALGVDAAQIAQGLGTAPDLGHRLRLLEVGRFRLLDDSYNASPVAMQAALSTLVALAGEAPRAALLGEMRELGHQSVELHRELGRSAAALDLSLLITVGETAAAIAHGALEAGMQADRVIMAGDIPRAVSALTSQAAPGSWVLVKASRGARLEEAIRLLSLEEQRRVD